MHVFGIGGKAVPVDISMQMFYCGRFVEMLMAVAVITSKFIAEGSP